MSEARWQLAFSLALSHSLDQVRAAFLSSEPWHMLLADQSREELISTLENHLSERFRARSVTFVTTNLLITDATFISAPLDAPLTVLVPLHESWLEWWNGVLDQAPSATPDPDEDDEDTDKYDLGEDRDHG